MSTEKFTQGGWYIWVSPIDGTLFIHSKTIKADRTICREVIDKRDAHLISAAPDMYRTLRDVADELPAEPDYFDYHTVRLTKEEVQAIRAALAKADGEQL